jgi:adenylate cyclase
MPPEETFTRRVCAVLLADVTGYSALMGEDDERTARAVQRLQAAVQGIVADASGRAEPVAGDALFATFDSVVAAVEAALQIQRRLAGADFHGLPLQLRIGIHFGDVLLREGAAFGDAINVAARLQTLAKPGTVCISDGVYRQVRNRFDEQFVDLGRQQLKNISDTVHAYLIVPRGIEVPSTHTGRRVPLAWGAAAAALAALGIVGVLTAERQRRATPAPAATPVVPVAEQMAEADNQPAEEAAQKVALGVMGFKSPEGDPHGEWRREALRDGLNTSLSQLSHVKVYSKEFIDFLITRKGMTDIEAASHLGISKMLSGSFVAVGETLRIETHVVDVKSGVLEASYTTEGQEAEFLELQNRLAFGVIARLNLPISDEEKRTLLAQRNTNLDALKMLLEAEGAAGDTNPKPAPGPQSALSGWQVLTGLWFPPAARADDSGAETAILATLERYRKATESRDTNALADLYTEFPPDQLSAQQRYFENVRDLKVVIDNAEIAVVGDEAVVSYTRTDDFVDARTGRPMHVAVRLTKILVRTDDGWRLAAGK